MKGSGTWNRMVEHHELFITKFEGDLTFRSPKIREEWANIGQPGFVNSLF